MTDAGKKIASVLLVEDDPTIFDAIEPYTHRRGWELRWARTVGEAKELLAQRQPDVVLLDRGLPGVSGDTLAKELLAVNLPFIMLTARDAELDRLAGFDLGADDYVSKPFSSAELIRRIEVALRRRGVVRVVIAEGVELDPESKIVRVRGDAVPLTPTEFELLAALARRPGRAYSRDELLDVLRLDLGTSARALDSHVKNLRRKLRDAGVRGELISTAVRTGYALKSR
jgi:two-component system response regulator BaeR